MYALPLVGLLRYQGPPMEEGFMLAFPQQLLDGRLPNRDFLHLYGPGSLWVLAGAFKVFGDTLLVERLVGLVQLTAIGGGVFWLARPWGRRIAVVCGATAAVIILPPTGLSAMAWNGAVGVGVCGLAVACWARRLPADDPRATRRFAVAGVLAGVALLYRPDLVIAISLGFGAALWGLERARVRAFLIAAGATSSLMLLHVAMAGIGPSFEGMFLEPVFELRGGRSLPVPPSWGELDGYLQKAGGLRVADWPLPMLETSNQVFLWFFITPLAALTVAGVGIWQVRSGRDRWRSQVLLAGGLFAVGLIPQGLQRPDTAHFAWVSCVGLGLLPVAIRVVAERLAPARPRLAHEAAGALAVAIVLVGVIPFFSVRTYADLTGQSFGRNRFGYVMERGDRRFYYGSESAARDAQEVIDRLDELAEPDQRLLVGPADLRKTPYSDAFLYYLFPELVPATRYIEMDPGIANAPDSGLADEVASADWLILSDVWSNWDEPNDSRVHGPDEPNQVVRDRFCTVVENDSFELLGRCEEVAADR